MVLIVMAMSVFLKNKFEGIPFKEIKIKSQMPENEKINEKLKITRTLS